MAGMAEGTTTMGYAKKGGVGERRLLVEAGWCGILRTGQGACGCILVKEVSSFQH